MFNNQHYKYRIVLSNQDLVVNSPYNFNELSTLLTYAKFAYLDGKCINTNQIFYFERITDNKEL